jgi:hypothetical protein
MADCENWCGGVDFPDFPEKDDPNSGLKFWSISVSGFSNYLTNKLLNHVFLGENYTAPSQFYLSFHTSNSGDNFAGAEVSSPSYSRVLASFEMEGNRIVKNTDLILSSTADEDWEEIYSVCLYDKQTGGNRLAWGNLSTPVVIVNGKAAAIAAGALKIRFN